MKTFETSTEKMKSFVALMFILSLGGSQALKCYECQDCKDMVGQSKSCMAGVHDVCMRMSVGPQIMKSCGIKQMCGGEGEKSDNPLIPNLADMFKDLPKGVKLNISCCESDHCNAGMKSLPSVSIILLPLVLVALFKS